MTDKQIIIDGIDVAKCRCFTSEWDFNNCGHICKRTECKYKRLWYKKQLARKEQECEKLKEEIKINGFGCFNIEMSEQLDQLKAENEELKAQLEQQKKGNEEFKEKLSQAKDITEPLNGQKCPSQSKGR